MLRGLCFPLFQFAVKFGGEKLFFQCLGRFQLEIGYIEPDPLLHGADFGGQTGSQGVLCDGGNAVVGEQFLHGVAPEQFKGKTKSFAFCFQAYAQGELKQPTATMLKVKGDIDEWCGKDAGGNVKCAAEKLFPILGEICSKYNECVEKINTSKLVRDNYRTFALLVDLQRYISNICTEENMMILSDTKDIQKYPYIPSGLRALTLPYKVAYDDPSCPFI